MALRLAFMGTPDFAVPALAELIGAGHEIAAVYTQPPRPAGRGQKPRPSPVQAHAESLGVPVRTPARLRDPGEIETFNALGLDIAVVAAYGLILPQAVLDAPRLGCVNIHASLLPRWRGAAPIQRAILAGDAETGITIMQMEAGLDTGPILMMERLPIGPETNAGQLHDALGRLGANLIVRALGALERGALAPVPQPEEGVTYAGKIDKEEARIDWTRPATDLDRLVRGLSPAPGAWTEANGARLRILRARPEAGIGEPGTVLDENLLVACGDGALRLLEIQREGRQPLPADAFLRGFPLPPGSRLG